MSRDAAAAGYSDGMFRKVKTTDKRLVSDAGSQSSIIHELAAACNRKLRRSEGACSSQFPHPYHARPSFPSAVHGFLPREQKPQGTNPRRCEGVTGWQSTKESSMGLRLTAVDCHGEPKRSKGAKQTVTGMLDDRN